MGTEAAEWLRIGVGGVVPVHWEDLSKADGGPGTVSGWASVYNVIDQQDDIVLPGAFKKALTEWRASGRVIPLVLDHDHTTEGVIGSITSMVETPYGLKFTATFSSVPEAQKARTKACEKHLAGLSIYGPIYKKSFEFRDGRELRILHQLGLMEVSLTPFPANDRALVTATKEKVSTTPWSQFSEADYTPEQWRRACLIDTGEGQVTAKSRYKLPVREPSGALNRNAVHAAAGGHGVSAVTGVAEEAKRAAARKLVGFYRNQLGEDPPERLLRLAGMTASASLPQQWVDDMRQALGISVPTARKAAVDVLVAAQYGSDESGEDDELADGPRPTDTEPEDDAAKYALDLIGGLPDAETDSIDALLAEATQDQVGADLRTLEAELKAGS